METIAVERGIWINAPTEQVWRAVTESAHLDLWYATHYRWEISALEIGGTRATILEAGYETIPADQRQEWFHKAGDGYTMSMENLRAFVEGRSLPF